MKGKYISLTALLLTVVMLFSACSLFSTESEDTDIPKVPQTTKSLPQPDPEVSELLQSFYRSELPQMAFKSGIKNAETGEEISCDFSMLQKPAFVDFDSDGEKEIVLLYDISEEAGEANMDVAVFLDEKDGQPGVVWFNSGSYGISDDEESYLLSYNDNKVCLVRIVKFDSCEAVLLMEYGSNGWTNTASAYHHISDHDSVKLESDSYYVDHASGGLFNAVTGKSVYSVEKFRNYRIPQEAYDELLNSLYASAILP